MMTTVALNRNDLSHERVEKIDNFVHRWYYCHQYGYKTRPVFPVYETFWLLFSCRKNAKTPNNFILGVGSSVYAPAVVVGFNALIIAAVC